MNVHRLLFIAMVVGLSVWTSGAGARLEAQQADSEAASKVKVSPGLAKIVKLVESGIGEEVVLAYVRNSPVPKPNADEIIYLHQAGVPNPVITALLSKNGTSNTSAASQPANSGRILAKPVYEQPPSAPASVVYVERPATYVPPQPTVVYVPSYAPQYYQYYSYPYYPRYYSSPVISFGFGFGGHHGFGHPLLGHFGNRGGHFSFGHGGGHHSGHGGLQFAGHSGGHH